MIYIFDFYYSDKSYLRYICFTKSARAVTWNPFFDFFKKISRDSLVTDLEGYNGFPQINIPFKFSRINHRPLAIMDGCSKCCEINTVSLTYGSLQVLPWNNDFHRKNVWLEMMSSYNRLLSIYAAWNQGYIKIIIHDISLLQFLSC